jgi:AcrR family transcriptional regulator
MKMNHEPAAGQELPAPRREPVQKRSRERYERMLTSATEIIAEMGSHAMRMSDVAARAEVAIGSLYQYFPDKAAIIRVLAERSHAECRRCIVERLADVQTVEEFRVGFREIFAQYLDMFRAEPVMRDIWSALQAEKSLAAVEMAESRASGRVVADILARLRPDADRRDLEESAFLVMYLGETAIRLASSQNEAEGRRTTQAYSRMALRALLDEGAKETG